MLKADRIADLLTAGRSAAADDPLVVVPFPDTEALRQSGSASVDLRLGTWFVAARKSRISHMEARTPEAHVAKTQYVPFGDHYFLHPRSFVLAATLEWVRLPTTLAGYVIGKSSWGRRGLIVATATAVHPGFSGCLTLELTNVSETPIEVYPGWALCQLCLHALDGGKGSVDASRNVGRRKPYLPEIEPDQIAKRLASAKEKPSSGP